MNDRLLLHLEGLQARYGEAVVLHGIDFDLIEGETVFVIGPNGAGKSTLLRCLAGRVAGEGRADFRGEDLLSLTTSQRIRRGVVLCPEGRRLFPEMTVRENLLLGTHSRRDSSGVEDDFDRLAQHLPWLPGRLEQAAGTLSGGEQQMVAVARALMARPSLLLVDEPTVGLSALAIRELQDWLRLQSREYGVTILGTEQNVVFARDIANRLAILAQGRIQTVAAPGELFAEGSAPGRLAERFFGTLLPTAPEKT